MPELIKESKQRGPVDLYQFNEMAHRHLGIKKRELPTRGTAVIHNKHQFLVDTHNTR